jgi:N-acetylglutamate synthase-like GNAT family acetyltransferase
MVGRDQITETRNALKGRIKQLFNYFRLACKRFEVMHETPSGKEDIFQAGYADLDSVILSCGYLDALSVYRYGELRHGKNFIDFLLSYPSPYHCKYYQKVSSLYLDQPPLDKSGKPRRFKFGSTEEIRKTLYGSSSPSTDTDVSIDEALNKLKIGGIQISREELNTFSYAAYFYERYRCYGVHNAQIHPPGVTGSTEPHYERSPTRLVFPASFVRDTLSAAIDNFESEVLSKIDAGEEPNVFNDYQWFKKTYNLNSKFIETVIAYYKYGSIQIRKCYINDFEVIYAIINEAAQAYKGVIPDDCWKEPYMSKEELQHEIDAGVIFWGYEEDRELVGVMGLQHIQDVALIRHSYVRTLKQKEGIGRKLLSYLRGQTIYSILVGTWADAVWAIRFYEKNGFRLVSREEKNRLLQKYWTISDRQIETSVVLVDEKWRKFCS